MAAKIPGSESSIKRIGQGPIGQFAPGSKQVPERKGSVPNSDMTANDQHIKDVDIFESVGFTE